jgi:hypothetical protein
MSATWPTHVVRRTLLERFRPDVVYDSREAFTAASVSEMLDDPFVELRRKDGVVIARPGTGPDDLNTEFFTAGGYRNSQPFAKADHIAFPDAHHDYRAQAREMERQHPDYANVVYGHFARDSTSERRFWLQYWYFMLYNDAQLIGRFGLHEGDWEMVQFRLLGDGPEWHDPQIDLAVYAQHAYAQIIGIDDLPLSADAQAPVAFSALGSHAHYIQSGIFKTEGLWDVADGRGPCPVQKLVYLDEDPPGWLLWPGTWGGTMPGIPEIESPSPPGPRGHRQWDDPSYLIAKARDVQPAKPPQITRIKIRRGLHHHPEIEFDFEEINEPTTIPGLLLVSISAEGERSPPATLSVSVADLLKANIVLRHALDPSVDYTVTVTWRDAAGTQSTPVAASLPRLPMSGTPLLRWILYGLRRVLQLVTPASQPG